jgi:hypothetical protein
LASAFDKSLLLDYHPWPVKDLLAKDILAKYLPAKKEEYGI